MKGTFYKNYSLDSVTQPYDVALKMEICRGKLLITGNRARGDLRTLFNYPSATRQDQLY